MLHTVRTTARVDREQIARSRKRDIFFIVAVGFEGSNVYGTGGLPMISERLAGLPVRLARSGVNW